MPFRRSVGKARKPKFELHLKICDLNNIPLVSGHSFVKWHLAHSMHAEHRGRTSKQPIVNHKVDYGYSKLVTGIRISIDKHNNLAECPIEFEVLQEFALAEKITLGHVRLDLSEYVEESESLGREIGSPPSRKRSGTARSQTSLQGEDGKQPSSVEEGVVRRYLMQDSRINSTLKIGILVVQVDGERNYVAPPLKTAPVFGGIAGLAAPEVEDETSPIPNISKPRDAAEVQDLYRRTLAASWSRQPNELPADECIEDIFSGGNGWKTKKETHSMSHDSDDDDNNGHHFGGDTLRPGDFRRHVNGRRSPSRSRRRTHSASSGRSASTVTGVGRGHARAGGAGGGGTRAHPEDRRDSRDDDLGSSLGSLAPTLGSSSSDGGRRGEPGTRRAKEVDEFEVRDDLVAWKLSRSVPA